MKQGKKTLLRRTLALLMVLTMAVTLLPMLPALALEELRITLTIVVPAGKEILYDGMDHVGSVELAVAHTGGILMEGHNIKIPDLTKDDYDSLPDAVQSVGSYEYVLGYDFMNKVKVYAGALDVTDLYDVVLVNSARRVKVTVTPRPVTVMVGAVEKIYGDDNPIFNDLAVISPPDSNSGLVGIDDLDLDITRDPDDLGEDVKPNDELYKLKATSNPNYAVILKGSLKITQRPVNVTVNAKKVYDKDVGDAGAKFDFDEFVVEKDEGKVPPCGLIENEELFTVDTKVTNLAREPGEDVDWYNLTGAEIEKYNPNYKVTVLLGKLTITPRPVKLDVTVTKTYGADDHDADNDVKIEVVKEAGDLGLAVGDDEDDLQVDWERTVGETGENVGDYGLIITVDNDNYGLVSSTGILKIKKASSDALADLIEVVDDEGYNSEDPDDEPDVDDKYITPEDNGLGYYELIKVYDGKKHGITIPIPEEEEEKLAGATVTYGIAADEIDSGTSPFVTNVSEGILTVYYKVTHPNYEDVIGKVTIKIIPRELTITIPDGFTKAEGGDEPEFEPLFPVEGLIKTDNWDEVFEIVRDELLQTKPIEEEVEGDKIWLTAVLLDENSSNYEIGGVIPSQLTITAAHYLQRLSVRVAVRKGQAFVLPFRTDLEDSQIGYDFILYNVTTKPADLVEEKGKEVFFTKDKGEGDYTLALSGGRITGVAQWPGTATFKIWSKSNPNMFILIDLVVAG